MNTDARRGSNNVVVVSKRKRKFPLDVYVYAVEKPVKFVVKKTFDR